MTKYEIVHHFRIPECDNRVRLCISNVSLDARSSRFLVSVEKQVDDITWATVDGTQRGTFWYYEEAEKMARSMYRVIVTKGMEVLVEETLQKSNQ